MDENNLNLVPEEEATPVSAEDGLAEAVSTAAAQEENAWNIPRTTVVDVRFKDGGKVYYFDPGELAVKTGDHVIVETARGIEFGYCANGVHQVPSRDITGQLRPVVRLATPADEKTRAANKAREKDAYQVCLHEIDRLGLDMQLASAEVAFDGSKILFFFTADGRVDFRELVKSLASAFHTRIELRQIGVRDKAKMIGGLGMCGRPFCCSEFLNEFQPVSIKMAKTQNLSLNPTKISGTCGRLMCCLKYEQEAYEDLIKNTPKNESFVDTPDGRGTVTDVNLLRQSVKVRMEKNPDTISTFKTCDVCVWRNGKAKKTDPPIPDDWAPISSDPNRRRRFDDEIPRLEDFLPGGKSANQEKAAEPASEQKSGSRRRRSSHKTDGQKAETAPKQAEKTAAEQNAGEKQAKKRSNHSRNRKKPQSGAKPQAATAQQKPPQKQEQPARQPQQVRQPQQAASEGGEQKKKSNNRRRHHHRKPSGSKPQGGAPADGAK